MKKKKIIIIVSILLLSLCACIVIPILIENIQVQEFNNKFLKCIVSPDSELCLDGWVEIDKLLDTTINNNKENDKKVSINLGDNKCTTIEELSKFKKILEKIYGELEDSIFAGATIKYDNQNKYIDNILLWGERNRFIVLEENNKRGSTLKITLKYIKNKKYDLKINFSNKTYTTDNYEELVNKIYSGKNYEIKINLTDSDVDLDINVVE